MPNYNEIFMTQFIQTLAQLSAGVVTAVFAVPVYSYYVKGNLFFSTNEYNEEYEISDINKEKSSNVNHDDRSSDTDVEDNVEETDEDEL
jgi:hypothetical protein|uniref:Uncharacterized protein n=1 Tax=viral metagenome TaxID=1070528 RepID=A0A6C0ANG4_9ZZZZ